MLGYRFLDRCFAQDPKDLGQRREVGGTREPDDPDQLGRDATGDNWLGTRRIEFLPVRRTVIVNARIKQRLKLRNGAPDS